jgi:hypothetical protein
MKTVIRPVRRLEDQFGLADRSEKAMPKPAVPSCPSAAPHIELRLADKGIIRRCEESLAETIARAMGIGSPKLRRTLFLVANGGGPR